jgi:predicted nucleotidyltransferase
VDEILRPILDDAERDPNVIGVYAMGSHGMGTADEWSDWDVVVVLAEGEPSVSRSATLDLIRSPLADLRSASSWETPAIAHSRVLLDKTGEVAELISSAGRVEREELAELYDNYLNDFYRSMKAWRRGRELGARIKGARSLWWLGQFLLGVEGRRAPYPSAWRGRLGDLEPLMLEVARTGDPRRQQALQAAVEPVAAAHGFRDVYDGWEGEIDRVMEFTFD